MALKTLGNTLEATMVRITIYFKMLKQARVHDAAWGDTAVILVKYKGAI